MGFQKKIDFFFSYNHDESYLIENNVTKKINCSKKQPKNKIVALSSIGKPSDIVLNGFRKLLTSSTSNFIFNYVLDKGSDLTVLL